MLGAIAQNYSPRRPSSLNLFIPAVMKFRFRKICGISLLAQAITGFQKEL